MPAIFMRKIRNAIAKRTQVTPIGGNSTSGGTLAFAEAALAMRASFENRR